MTIAVNYWKWRATFLLQWKCSKWYTCVLEHLSVGSMLCCIFLNEFETPVISLGSIQIQINIIHFYPCSVAKPWIFPLSSNCLKLHILSKMNAWEWVNQFTDAQQHPLSKAIIFILLVDLLQFIYHNLHTCIINIYCLH